MPVPILANGQPTTTSRRAPHSQVTDGPWGLGQAASAGASCASADCEREAPASAVPTVAEKARRVISPMAPPSLLSAASLPRGRSPGHAVLLGSRTPWYPPRPVPTARAEGGCGRLRGQYFASSPTCQASWPISSDPPGRKDAVPTPRNRGADHAPSLCRQRSSPLPSRRMRSRFGSGSRGWPRNGRSPRGIRAGAQGSSFPVSSFSPRHPARGINAITGRDLDVFGR